MSFGRLRAGVRFVGGIKMAAGGAGIGRAAIAKFMDVKAVLSGCKACDLCVHLHAIRDWREGDSASSLCCPPWDEAPR